MVGGALGGVEVVEDPRRVAPRDGPDPHLHRLPTRHGGPPSRLVDGRVVEQGVAEELLRRIEHEGELRTGVLAGPLYGAGRIVDARLRRLVDPPRPFRTAEDHPTAYLAPGG